MQAQFLKQDMERAFIEYDIPFTGLKEGLHRYSFEVSDSFFQNIEASPIANGNVKVTLDFDKHPSMFVLQFEAVGSVKLPCDRCLEEYDQTVDTDARFMVRFSDDPHEEEEIIYIAPSDTSFNVAHLIYEIITLSLPIKWEHPNDSCLAHIEKYLVVPNEDTPVADEPLDDENPLWREMQKLKDKLN